MDVRGDLEQSMNEEAAAAHAYRTRANYAYAVGDRVSAELWMHIADEEDGHYREFRERLSFVPASPEVREHAERMEEALGRRHPSQVGIPGDKRPSPQTYGDWVNLAEDIKARDDNPETWDRTNDSLGIISGGITGNIDDAKHWLTRKAGELGIL